MNIYCLSYMHPEHGNCLSYYGRLNEARVAFLKIQAKEKEDGYEIENGDHTIHSYRIAGKRQFIAFLNEKTPAHDNG